MVLANFWSGMNRMNSQNHFEWLYSIGYYRFLDVFKCCYWVSWKLPPWTIPGQLRCHGQAPAALGPGVCDQRWVPAWPQQPWLKKGEDNNTRKPEMREHEQVFYANFIIWNALRFAHISCSASANSYWLVDPWACSQVHCSYSSSVALP